MGKTIGMNITVTLYRRVKLTDNAIGGRVSDFVKTRQGLPARITASPSPLIFRVQGIETQDFYNCVVWAQDYVMVDVIADDILVPESGQYVGKQFRIQSVEESSFDDNPNSYRAMNKRLNLKYETPALNVNLPA